MRPCKAKRHFLLTLQVNTQILPIAIAGESSDESESNLKSVNKIH